MIADSWIEIEQFRLLVLRTAWRIDKYKDYKRVRKDISAVKAAMPKVLHDVAARALQIHGSLGVSNEMPFSAMVIESFHMGLADGPTEVHKVTVARQVLREYAARPTGLFPTGHLPTLPRRGAGPVRRRARAPRRPSCDAATVAVRTALRSGRARSSTGPRSRPTCAADLAGLDGRVRGAAVPERLGQPHLPAALRRRPSWCCAGRRSAWSRPAPTTCGASTGCCRGCGSSSTGRRGRYLFCDDHDVIGADFVVMERRRGEVVRDGVPGVDGRPPRRRPPGRLRPRRRAWPTCTCSTRRRPAWPTSAGPRASSSARWPAGRRAGSWCAPTTARR